jgi:hypothetical protein
MSQAVIHCSPQLGLNFASAPFKASKTASICIPPGEEPLQANELTRPGILASDIYERLKTELEMLRAGVTRLQCMLDDAQVDAEKATLPEFAQAKFQRIVARETRTLRARYAKAFDAAVAAKVKKLALQEQYYIEKVNETNLLLERIWAHQKMLSQSMTLEEFKAALGCVHPDLQLENEHTGHATQFQIFRQVAKPRPKGGNAHTGKARFVSPE